MIDKFRLITRAVVDAAEVELHLIWTPTEKEWRLLERMGLWSRTKVMPSEKLETWARDTLDYELSQQALSYPEWPHPTRGKHIKFSCCGQIVTLVQRGYDSGPLTWSGIPCNCNRTYTYQNDSDDRSHWEEVEPLHPTLARMYCWAIPKGPVKDFCELPGDLLDKMEGGDAR